MRRRALLIGSRTGALAGVADDVRAMREALIPYGFACTTVRDDAATYHGIRAAYRTLIARTAPGDAALVYYTGHGARYRNPGAGPPWLRYLVTTDRRLVDGGEFMGLLAEELSLLQVELTARTDNVTVILDCCYAARMSRGPTFLPKALTTLPAPLWPVIAARWRRLRAAALEVGADSNPFAVRVVACGPDEAAYELPPEFGGPRGALTAALTDALRRPGAADLSWQELIALVRPAVQELLIGQHPQVEGPAARRLFTVEEKQRTGVLPVLVDDEGPYLAHPALFGVTPGDTYAVAAVGAGPAAPRVTGTVTSARGPRARLRLDRELPAAAGRPRWEAHPVSVAVSPLPVAVAPAGHPDRDRVEQSISDAARWRPAGPGERPFATVRIEPGGLALLDAAGEELIAGPAAAPAVVAQLALTARAARLRELRSGAGDTALDDDVAVGFALLRDGAAEPVELSGAPMFLGDEVVTRLHNRGAGQRYVSVFDIGLRGAVTLLSTSEPDGVRVPPGGVHELYRAPVGDGLAGIRLFWPPDLPRGGPRAESLLVIVTDRPQDLRALEQRGTPRRGPAGSSLQALIDDLVTGRRAGGGPARSVVRHRVHRFDFLLHPRERPLAEPPFPTDLRPDLSVRLSPPRPPRPSRLAVRLAATGIPTPAGAADDWLHVVAVAPAADGRLHLRRTSVRRGDSAEIFDAVVDGALEVAVFGLPARLEPDEAVLAPAGPVDAMADLVRRIVAGSPEARPLLRATLLAADVPATLRTAHFVLVPAEDHPRG